MESNKVCKQCAKPFRVKPSLIDKIHFCSIECRDRNGSVDLKCQHCGVTYTVKASHKDRSKFCSRSCLNDGRSMVKVCECCGIEFKVPKRRNESVRFCSLACKTQGRRTTVECEMCKKPFSFPAHQDKKFCSVECFHAAPKPKGEEHYKWIGESYEHNDGYVRLTRSGIGANLKMQHREVILMAIVKENPNHPFLVKTNDGFELSHAIHVHHIDRNKSNNELSNLLALTPSAHSQIHRSNRKPDPWECYPSNPEKW